VRQQGVSFLAIIGGEKGGGPKKKGGKSASVLAGGWGQPKEAYERRLRRKQKKVRREVTRFAQ